MPLVRSLFQTEILSRGASTMLCPGVRASWRNFLRAMRSTTHPPPPRQLPRCAHAVWRGHRLGRRLRRWQELVQTFRKQEDGPIRMTGTKLGARQRRPNAKAQGAGDHRRQPFPRLTLLSFSPARQIFYVPSDRAPPSPLFCVVQLRSGYGGGRVLACKQRRKSAYGSKN